MMHLNGTTYRESRPQERPGRLPGYVKGRESYTDLATPLTSKW